MKFFKKLLTKRGRGENKLFIIDGIHTVKEAIKSDWEIKYLIFSESFKKMEEFDGIDVEKFKVSDRIMNLLSKTENPQGIIGIVKMKNFLLDLDEDRFVILDEIQDPGNLGTIIRTSDAAGFTTVILDKGTVDPYNPKVIRSTQGSIFHVKIVNNNIRRAIEKLKKGGVKILGTSPKGRKLYTNIKEKGRVGIVFGNESRGVKEEILLMCDETIRIPIYGKAESLNVAVSAGIILYYFAKNVS